MKADLARLLADARDRGWRVDRLRSGHHRLRHPSGATVITGSTPSCARAVRNAAAMLRRAERASMEESAR